MKLVVALSFDIDPATRPSKVPDPDRVWSLRPDELILDWIPDGAALRAALAPLTSVRRVRSGFRITRRSGKEPGAIGFALAPWSGGEIILSLEAAKEWSRRARSGYELVPVYPHEGPLATRLREYEELLDRHIPVARRHRR